MTRSRSSRPNTLLPQNSYLPGPGKSRRPAPGMRRKKSRGTVSAMSIATFLFRVVRFAYALPRHAGMIAIVAGVLLWYSPALRGYVLSLVLPTGPEEMLEIMKAQF